MNTVTPLRYKVYKIIDAWFIIEHCKEIYIKK